MFTYITDKELIKQGIISSLELFNPISLEEMEGIKLLDRLETKFVFHISLLPAILRKISDKYRILEIEGRRESMYETIYFDDDGFTLYRMHHNGKANRYKLRIRRYLDSNLAFYELKTKNQKRRSIKTRISCPDEIAKSKSLSPFLGFCCEAVDSLDNVHPSLKVNYSRITFVSSDLTERLTFDTRLKFDTETSEKLSDEICIAEVKQPGGGISPFVSLMHELHISPLRISKYCLGLITHYPDIKKNNFKPRLMRIARILKSNINNNNNIDE